MNTIPQIPSPQPLRQNAHANLSGNVRPYNERDFGIGYGRSSGYATARRYASPWNGQPRFRCV